MTDPNLPSAPTPPQNYDKLWIVLAHLSLMLSVPFLLPLIIFLVKKDESPLVAAHAKEALNFHISLLIYSACTLPLFLVCFVLGIPFLIVLGLAAFICALIAAIHGAEGGFYRYPLTLRLIP